MGIACMVFAPSLVFCRKLVVAGEGADGGAEKQAGAGEWAGEGAGEGDKLKGEEEPSSPSMTPEQVEEFFQRTIARLTSPEEREVIKSKVNRVRVCPACVCDGSLLPCTAGLRRRTRPFLPTLCAASRNALLAAFVVPRGWGFIVR